MSFDFGGSSGGSSSSSSDWTTPANPQTVPTTPSSGGSGFGTSLPPEAPFGETTSAPVVWLAAGLLATVVAIGLHFVLDGFAGGVVGWLVGGPVAIGLLALFIRFDTERRGQSFYAESEAADWGRRALVALALVAVALNAWAMADVIARGGL